MCGVVLSSSAAAAAAAPQPRPYVGKYHGIDTPRRCRAERNARKTFAEKEINLNKKKKKRWSGHGYCFLGDHDGHKYSNKLESDYVIFKYNALLFKSAFIFKPTPRKTVVRNVFHIK